MTNSFKNEKLQTAEGKTTTVGYNEAFFSGNYAVTMDEWIHVRLELHITAIAADGKVTWSQQLYINNDRVRTDTKTDTKLNTTDGVTTFWIKMKNSAGTGGNMAGFNFDIDNVKLYSVAAN